MTSMWKTLSNLCFSLPLSAPWSQQTSLDNSNKERVWIWSAGTRRRRCQTSLWWELFNFAPK